jgi:hypothetical protein
MGRGSKVVADASTGLDRRDAGYYATPDFVAKLLASEAMRLSPAARSVFDPCVGREELLRAFPPHLSAASMDVRDFPGVQRRATFQQRDFLRWFAERKAAGGVMETDHDILVANPPYNCHEADYVRRNRSWLLQAFPEVGVGNTCALFASALIDLARPGAVLALLLSDALLTSKAHAPLRRKLLAECTLHALLLCPQDLFRSQSADVRTCILLLRKGAGGQRQVLTCDRAASSEQFERVLRERSFERLPVGRLVLDAPRDNQELVVGVPDGVRQLFSGPRLCDAFDCVTGISTGNDRAYLSKVQDAAHRLPFFKNPASRRFFMRPDGFLRSDFLQLAGALPNFIVRNRAYHAREGVACSSMGARFGACYLPEEALFGVNPNVFPRGDADLWWLLAYLNGTLATFLVRKALARTNMLTSGYLARLPLPALEQAARTRLGALAREAHATGRCSGHDAAVARIDELVFSSVGIGEADAAKMRAFAADVVNLV